MHDDYSLESEPYAPAGSSAALEVSFSAAGESRGARASGMDACRRPREAI